ncbi:CLUMA_CG019648, isoform A [Clunio marinus]|uniref:CLUMA_CG019648, isoform A n=1 Tax=Clunio marinus TaxID=568069 RepID=A0A1J1J3D9_9DIPT|nr:CLUMA_CG019648, isoform A [Clunio marinus]
MTLKLEYESAITCTNFAEIQSSRKNLYHKSDGALKKGQLKKSMELMCLNSPKNSEDTRMNGTKTKRIVFIVRQKFAVFVSQRID